MRCMYAVLTWFHAAKYLSMQFVKHVLSLLDSEEPGFVTHLS